MKINRKALVDACNAAIAAHRARHDAADDRWQAYLVEHRDAWHAEHADAWLRAAGEIRRTIANGGAVTDRILPMQRNGYRSIAAYETPSVGPAGTRDPGEYVAPQQLHTLRKTLDLIVDDEVTVSNLAALGITGKTLRDALAYVGRAAA